MIKLSNLTKIKLCLKEFEYGGAVVSNSIPRLYKWNSLLNSSSLYPSIIMSHKICYSIFIKDNTNQLFFNIKASNKKSCIFIEEPLGLIPSCQKALIAREKKLKCNLVSL